MKRAMFMRALVLFALSGACTSSTKDLFADEGTPSASATELLAKNDPITSEGIAGVYERKGQGSGLYQAGGTTYQVINDWVLRTEFRENVLSTAFKCALTYTEPGRAPKALVVFTQQDAAATSDVYSVKTAALKTEADPISMSDCKIDQAAEAWPFCNERTEGTGIYVEVPAGANTCIGRWDQYLYFVRGSYSPDSNFGVKVAN